ncbi:potassium transporter Kup [Bradyrhizobium sp.]|uniref:potassium transporter Kup n=1 Tax=Bradyrhizobium sp. TaxID=376 RepID=UPI001ECFBE51|nr:KUP/HAK/KT family potassium transporter [Bradyrhizobium sp.]MBV8918273.1 KUP/HAK/KT family potassium transporter [Bradyrhizobium sp.]MBV9985160.1 KUP/HAK/KT family potassium transporter [Bradyrhizobium sp.]
MAQVLQAEESPRHYPQKLPAAAVLTALGVVYGDIGTSTLYGLKQAVDAGGAPTPETVIGTVSLIFWALLLIVGLKYAILILRADNRGEGGIVALLALLDARHAPRGSARASLLVVGLIGAALLYGDGVITPAISVLSAVEGLKIDAPALAPMVVPITIAILVGLFLVQRKGTEFVGTIFGPVMLVWFLAIAVLGLKGIVQSPAILAAISPHHAVLYLGHAGPGIAFAVLGAAFLTLTGAEAMYADMGHFGRLPIQFGWFAIVSPALMLNYLGQGGLLLADPQAAENPFYLLVPRWAHYPMVAFATLATVIASQAIISGAYSLTQQAMQLGFLPRMRVNHTASHEKGQIYIPLVNWLLAGGTLSAVLLFRSSDALGGAYGIAVAMLMAITTVLAALVALKWGYNPLLVVAVNGFFLVIELVFVAANMTKLVEGGWFPLLLAAVIAFLMLTWRTGWQLLEQERSKLRQPEDAFVEWVINTPPIRLPGAAAIFTAATTGIPLCLTHHLRHNRVLHERVLFIASIIVDAPRVDASERVTFVPVGGGITRVLFHFGFMETPDVMAALRLACRRPELAGIDPENITYYFRRVMVIASDRIAGMAVWRKALFAMMHLNANLPAAYFGVPPSQVVEVGLEVEI